MQVFKNPKDNDSDLKSSFQYAIWEKTWSGITKFLVKLSLPNVIPIEQSNALKLKQTNKKIIQKGECAFKLFLFFCFHHKLLHSNL